MFFPDTRNLTADNGMTPDTRYLKANKQVANISKAKLISCSGIDLLIEPANFRQLSQYQTSGTF
jgi:hypothetical protein